MSERLTGAWKEGATAAVLRPYPIDHIGGVADIARTEIDFLRRHGFKTKEVTPRPSWSSRTWNDSNSMSLGVTLHTANHERVRTDAPWATFDPNLFDEIQKLTELLRANYISVHSGSMYWPAYHLVSLAKIVSDPDRVIFDTEHALANRHHLLKFKLASEAQRLGHFYDRGIVNSRKMQTLYESLGFEFDIIHNPVNRERFNPDGPKLETFGDINFLDGKINIVYIGRLEHRKGLQTALRAFALLVKDKEVPKNFRFIIAGSGPDEEKLHRMAEELKLTNYVVFMGIISEEEKPKLYRIAHFCYFPSESEESFGNVLLEAWASEVPSLNGMAYDPELVRNGVNGFLQETASPHEAAYSLRKMILNPQWVRYMGKQAREFTCQFDTEVIGWQKLDLAQTVHAQKLRKAGRTISYPT